MDLETPAPTNQKASPTNFGSLEQFFERTTQKEGDRKSKTFEIPVTALYSPQEGLQHREADFRPFKAQRVHKLPIVQDANHQGSPPPPSSRFLDNLRRPTRRLLACTNSPKQETLFGVPLQRPGMAISSNAIRPERGPQGLYKTSVSCGSRNGPSGHMVPTLPGRSPNHRTNKRNVPSPYTVGSSNPDQVGFQDQQQKVPPNPISGVYLARNRLGSQIALGSSSPGQSAVSSNIPIVYSSFKYLHKENRNAATGFSKLHRPVRPSDSDTPRHNSDHITPIQTNFGQRPHTDPQTLETETLQMEQNPNNSTTFGFARSNSNYSDRCITSRLGVPNKSTTLPWSVRQINKTLHQHIGTSDDLVCLVDSQYQKSGNSSPLRQHNSHSSSEERQFPSVSTIVSSRADLETGHQVQLDSHSFTHRRQVQYPCRPTIKKHDTIIRMVTTTSNLQQDSTTKSCIAGRSVCHTPQQSAASFPCSLSGSKGSSYRCPNNSLGHMETPLSVSSNSAHLKSISETHSYSIHQRHSGDSGGPNETMVYGSSITQGPFSSTRNSAHTDSGEQSSDSSPTYQTSRVEVLKYAYYTRFPHSHKVVNLLANPIRKSSQGDYERKWHYFCSFLRERGIPFNAITLHCVLDFLAYLFIDKKLQPSTVSHYRSALTVPLRLQYNVDLNDNLVTTLLKAMFLQRPKTPTAAPAWCLNKVLTYIDNLPAQLEVESSLQKCAFLLLLATGWRISELHACVRDTAYCRFLDDSTLLIRPHPSFLAKNESTEKRWQHENIKPLMLHDGSPSHLCPVRALQKYLGLTSSFKTGCLFLSPKTGKPLSIRQLSLTICKLIRQADPLATQNPKVHDIRKYASSCALSETMQTSNMIDALHWRSPHTFWKYYMAPTSPLSMAVILPGLSTSTGSAPESPHHS